MKIYTRSGDQGETALFGGKKIDKDSLQIEAYGSIDELTSFLGLIKEPIITTIQRDLSKIMAVLCDSKITLENEEKRIAEMEAYIDMVESKKPTGTKFILIQGTQSSVICHIARTVCRRAERRMVAFLKVNTEIDKKNAMCMLQYLNRLSDMLYAMGRLHNTEEELFV